MRGAADGTLETELEIAGQAVPVTVRPHARAMRISLRLARQRHAVKVTVPDGVPLKKGLDFARSRADWIGKHLAARPAPRPFVHGARIPLRGADHMIFHVPGRRGVVWAEGEGEAARICVAGAMEHLPRRLTDWLKEQARRDLQKACSRYSTLMDVSYRRLSVRDQKSRWGSCSSGRNLSFSWRLIFAPPHVLDYLAAHEVAHLAHMNHSPAFWRLVRAHCPHVDEAEAWLKQHGAGLYLWGAEG